MFGNTIQDVLSSNEDKSGGAAIGVDSADRVQDASGKVAASQSRTAEFDDTIQNSAPLNTMVQDNVRNKLNDTMEKTLPLQSNVSDEIVELLSQTNEDQSLYLHPRHFAQLGHRHGFILYLTDRNSEGPTTIEIKFEKGIYTTHDVRVVGAIQLAIKRRQGVASQIREISGSHYRAILERGRAADTLRGVGGLVSTADARRGEAGKPSSELVAENEQLKQQLEAMREQVARASATTDNSKKMFGQTT